MEAVFFSYSPRDFVGLDNKTNCVVLECASIVSSESRRVIHQNTIPSSIYMVKAMLTLDKKRRRFLLDMSRSLIKVQAINFDSDNIIEKRYKLAGIDELIEESRLKPYKNGGK